MTISFTRLDPAGVDHDALVEFMTQNQFPFHERPRPCAADVEASISAGAYRDEDNDSFWIDHHEFGRIGFFRLEDLSDDAPLASVAYGIIRRDWETGQTTTFVWDDLTV